MNLKKKISLIIQSSPVSYEEIEWKLCSVDPMDIKEAISSLLSCEKIKENESGLFYWVD
jgi:hypothetical protein